MLYLSRKVRLRPETTTTFLPTQATGAEERRVVARFRCTGTTFRTTFRPTQATGAEERPRSSKFRAAGTTFRKKIALSRRRRDGPWTTTLYLCSKVRFGPKNFLHRIRCTGTVFRNKMSLARRRHARRRYETLYLCSKVRFLVRGVALQKRCCDPITMKRSAGS